MEKQDIAVISIIFSAAFYLGIKKNFLGDESDHKNINQALTEWFKYLKETFIDKLKSENASNFYEYLKTMINDHYEKKSNLDGLKQYVKRVSRIVKGITNKN